MEFTTAHDAYLVRGGCSSDVKRLLQCGGRIVKQGRAVRVQEKADSSVLQIPYVLIAFGESRRRILILLTERDEQDEQNTLAESERSRPAAQQLPRAS
jgi:hypothetical protein